MSNIVLADNKNIHHSVQQSSVYTIYISGHIGAAEDYIEEIQILKNASEDTEINIIINSEGGSVATALQIVYNIVACRGNVHGIIEGLCYSAATYIFLACHDWEISPFSHMMIHNYSGGQYGRGNEIVLGALETDKWVSNSMRELYSNFLTEEELVTVAHTDIYLGPEQIIDRLQKLAKYRDSLALEDEQRSVDALIEDLQKRIGEPEDAEQDSGRVPESPSGD